MALIFVLGVAALLTAWLVNGLVGMLSGEKPGDTGRLGGEIFLRIFVALELGIVGRVLNYVGLTGLPRKLVLFTGLLCVLSFLIGSCRHAHNNDTRFHRFYGVTNSIHKLYSCGTGVSNGD
jgi:hypothetical protein